MGNSKKKEAGKNFKNLGLNFDVIIRDGDLKVVDRLKNKKKTIIPYLYDKYI